MFSVTIIFGNLMKFHITNYAVQQINYITLINDIEICIHISHFEINLQTLWKILMHNRYLKLTEYGFLLPRRVRR
jgi:hypothetical protein